MEQVRAHGEILARLDNRGKSGSELQKEATQRKQEELRDKYFNVLRDIRRPLPEEPLQPAAQYKARLRELRPLEAEKKREAAKRGQVAKILKRKRVHNLRSFCGELAVEANGTKAQMNERIVAARLRQEPTTEADAPAEPPAAEPPASGRIQSASLA